DDAGAPVEPGRSSSRSGSGGGRRLAKARGPAVCRVCGKALVTPRERTVRRCDSCPVSSDERLVESLRAWRLEQARERSVPAYVIFTDAPTR
ncbi:MAG: HRDC domain-containing protein, partial [Candidatus Nanopelagicales bacterium]